MRSALVAVCRCVHPLHLHLRRVRNIYMYMCEEEGYMYMYMHEEKKVSSELTVCAGSEGLSAAAEELHP